MVNSLMAPIIVTYLCEKGTFGWVHTEYSTPVSNMKSLCGPLTVIWTIGSWVPNKIEPNMSSSHILLWCLALQNHLLVHYVVSELDGIRTELPELCFLVQGEGEIFLYAMGIHSPNVNGVPIWPCYSSGHTSSNLALSPGWVTLSVSFTIGLLIDSAPCFWIYIHGCVQTIVPGKLPESPPFSSSCNPPCVRPSGLDRETLLLRISVVG